MSQDARRDEEDATLRRARLLGFNYVDTSTLPQKALYKDLLPKEEMYQKRIVPLQADQSNILFGITTTTSQQTINEMRQRFSDVRTAFAVISDSGYREYMRLYDPPKQVTYQDIAFTAETTDDFFKQVSDTLAQVRADDILAYLVQQGYRLKASDIHLENQNNAVRIRFRVDGALHPIANITPDKYRILFGSIASRANISTAATTAQTGHMQKEMRNADGTMRTLNMRIETVPTVFGQDAVIRLFNFDPRLLNLDHLGLSDSQKKSV